MANSSAKTEAALAALKGRTLVLVGMMGAGKTSVGKRVAQRLGLPFVDADAEIELAAGMSIPEIFAKHGEPSFRDGERKVIARLMDTEQKVLATGGGAFINAETRAAIKRGGVSVWLKADFDVLMARVRRKGNRPLLQTADPDATMRKLIADRYPIYAEADLTVESRDVAHEVMVDAVIDALSAAPARFADEPGVIDLAPVVVPVGLGERAYDILIGAGLVDTAGTTIAGLMPGVRAAIVVDDTVAALHLARLQASLSAAGIDSVPVEVPAGEPSKSFAVLQDVVDRILAARLERGDVVIAFGGGVIGDLAGFAAGIVRRGMKFVQMPTTLLAMVDSSVGGKTGINARHGKNLIGIFNQPQLVIADTDLLKTLSPREFRAGYAEVVKYGLIGDKAFFEWLDENRAEVFAGGPALTRAIAVSCRAKAKVVEEDEHETGVRALLNLGHTFGHALEKAVGYNGDRLVHGEGVSIGMTLAHQFSVHMNLLSPDDASRMEAHLVAVGLPTRLHEIPGGVGGVDGLMAAIGQDKKVKRGRLTFILTRGIGEAFIADDVPADVVRDFLGAKLAAR